MLFFTLLLLFQLPQNETSFQSAELFMIKGEYSSGEIMQAVEDVEVFDDGSFVLYEFRMPYLQYLDKDGNYVQQVSRSGRGPGEFSDIWNISMVDDKVLVVDRRQYKITEIDPDLNLRDVARIKHAEEIGQIITDQNNKRYAVAAYFSKDIPVEQRMIFRKLDNEFNYTDRQFGSVSSINDEPEGSVEQILTEKFSSMHGFNSLFNAENEIVASYRIYDGMMRVYSPETGNLERKIRTGDYDVSSVNADDIEIKTFADATTKGVNASSTTIDGEPFRIKYQIYNKSLALEKLRDGRIIHFVQKKKGKTAILIAEIFDPSATELLQSMEIKELGDLKVADHLYQHEDYARITLRILKLDHLNRLFVADEDPNGEPELHVIQIDL